MQFSDSKSWEIYLSILTMVWVALTWRIFRLLYELCKDIGMVSVEQDPEVFKRQKFHLPCGTLKLWNVDFTDFLRQYEPNGQKSIFWLDYENLTFQNFENFMLLLTKIAEGKPPQDFTSI